MKTEKEMWAVVDKTGLGHLDKNGSFTLLTARSDARSVKSASETVKRVKVTVENA